ncbi:MAG: putative molybdenum carrier protein [Halobacteriota archaeon]|nr:putative molybdenum carrier protein [Halobacteriota archaeon]
MGEILLKEVISGGQIGVDQAGLLAAKENYYLTGGWAPKNYRTRNGNRPDILRDIFFLKERETHSYKMRTFANVQDSDGTLLFCNDFGSTGIKCTKEAIAFYNKPSFDVFHDIEPNEQLFERIIDWIIEHKIKVLNIAGNSQPPSDIFVRAYKFLNGLFIYIRQQQGGDPIERDSYERIAKNARLLDGRYRRRQKVRRKGEQSRRYASH